MAEFQSNTFLQRYFTDCASMLALLDAYGFDKPQAGTADKWWRRGAVPGSWLPMLLAVLELEHGGPISVLPYIARPPQAA